MPTTSKLPGLLSKTRHRLVSPAGFIAHMPDLPVVDSANTAGGDVCSWPGGLESPKRGHPAKECRQRPSLQPRLQFGVWTLARPSTETSAEQRGGKKIWEWKSIKRVIFFRPIKIILVKKQRVNKRPHLDSL